MTISCQNNVLFQHIIHLFKVFESSNLSVLQFINNFANLCESSVSMKKEKDLLSLLQSRKRITFSLSRAENISVFNIRFQFFQVLFSARFNTCYIYLPWGFFFQKGSEIWYLPRGHRYKYQYFLKVLKEFSTLVKSRSPEDPSYNILARVMWVKLMCTSVDALD